MRGMSEMALAVGVDCGSLTLLSSAASDLPVTKCDGNGRWSPVSLASLVACSDSEAEPRNELRLRVCKIENGVVQRDTSIVPPNAGRGCACALLELIDRRLDERLIAFLKPLLIE